jgi:hypothetical protein
LLVGTKDLNVSLSSYFLRPSFLDMRFRHV